MNRRRRKQAGTEATATESCSRLSVTGSRDGLVQGSLSILGWRELGLLREPLMPSSNTSLSYPGGAACRLAVLGRKGNMAVRENGEHQQTLLSSIAFLPSWLWVGVQRDQSCLRRASPCVPATPHVCQLLLTEFILLSPLAHLCRKRRTLSGREHL